jgi:glycosyltransferase involved in cell wall biosynthesis
MRIGMALPNRPFPPDIRVTKEAQALAPFGHECLLLCRRESGQAEVEEVASVTAVRMRVHPESALRRRLDSFRFLLTLDSPAWRHGMVSLVREHGAGAIHVHDLEYAWSGVKAAAETGVPLVVDLHENYPVALSLYKRRAIDRLLFSPKRAARLERRVLARADRIVVVVEEAKARLVALGGDPDKIVVFGNSEPRALAEPEPPALDLKSGPRIVYVGGIARHRGLDTAVRAMVPLLAGEPLARLTIVGDGDALDGLKRLAHELGVDRAIDFTGRLGFDDAMQYVRSATVALVPHHRSAHTDATVPHKLFQYMALGRPVLVSDCVPLERIVTETRAGLVFPSGDADALAARVLEMHDPERARLMAEAGRAAVLDRWNLEADAAALDGLYRSLDASASR